MTSATVPALIRIPAPTLQKRQRSDGWESSEERKYKHAYQTADGRWLIERAYGACGGGWNVFDTTGEHVGASWYGLTPHLQTLPTLSAAKAFVSEWAI
jgi:hypothetical protein